jgi:hypothetical protein
MHAEHADNSEVNDLSEHTIVLCSNKAPRLITKASWSVSTSFGKPCLEIKRVAYGVRTAPRHQSVLRATPSSFALRFLLGALQLYVIAARPILVRTTPNRSKSL